MSTKRIPSYKKGQESNLVVISDESFPGQCSKCNTHCEKLVLVKNINSGAVKQICEYHQKIDFYKTEFDVTIHDNVKKIQWCGDCVTDHKEHISLGEK